MPERSTLRGAVSSFQVDSAWLTAVNGSRGNELAVTLLGLHGSVVTATRPRVSV